MLLNAVLLTGLAPAPIDVLHAWDAQRRSAFAAGDVASLRRLYVSGSAAGERDVVMLRTWGRAGWRVSAMTTQVYSVRSRESGGALRLELVDRTMSGITGHGICRRLPTPVPRMRTVVMKRVEGRWLVDSVSAL